MIKLFVVDDEQDTREGLRYYVDWARFNIQVIGDADDGLTAIDPIMKERPDIVLTDVRMPGMDGLTLALKLREAGVGARIIFISGYEDVSYMKTALKVDAIDYILKPMDQEELAQVMHKVTGLIQEERIFPRRKQEMQSLVVLYFLKASASLRRKRAKKSGHLIERINEWKAAGGADAVKEVNAWYKSLPK